MAVLSGTISSLGLRARLPDPFSHPVGGGKYLGKYGVGKPEVPAYGTLVDAKKYGQLLLDRVPALAHGIIRTTCRYGSLHLFPGSNRLLKTGAVRGAFWTVL